MDASTLIVLFKGFKNVTYWLVERDKMSTNITIRSIHFFLGGGGGDLHDQQGPNEEVCNIEHFYRKLLCVQNVVMLIT